jgi:hypothetical protein
MTPAPTSAPARNRIWVHAPPDDTAVRAARTPCYWCGDPATTTREDDYGYTRPACRHCA